MKDDSGNAVQDEQEGYDFKRDQVDLALRRITPANSTSSSSTPSTTNSRPCATGSSDGSTRCVRSGATTSNSSSSMLTT